MRSSACGLLRRRRKEAGVKVVLQLVGKGRFSNVWSDGKSTTLQGRTQVQHRSPSHPGNAKEIAPEDVTKHICAWIRR